jgi:DNA-binding NtrC family response regulator
MIKETILILDRENHTRWVLKSLLENEQYLVIAVDSIERALQNFSEFEVSCLITEYRVAQSRALETVQELKSRSPEAYVMMLTADEATEKEYEEIMTAGVDDYFIKPFPSWKILLHLRKGLRQRGLLLQKKRLDQELNGLRAKEGTLPDITPENGAENIPKNVGEECPAEETLVSNKSLV